MLPLGSIVSGSAGGGQCLCRFYTTQGNDGPAIDRLHASGGIVSLLPPSQKASASLQKRLVHPVLVVIGREKWGVDCPLKLSFFGYFRRYCTSKRLG
jgi:hypothetical protein